MAYPIEEMIARAKEHAEPLRELQEIARVGLDDTMCDVIAAGFVRASVEEIRDQAGRLSVPFTDAMYTHSFARWYQGGLPRFRLSHGLAAKLALTDVDGIDAENIRIPFPTFMIELPYPHGPLVADAPTKTTDVITLLASRYLSSSSMPRREVRAESLAEYLRWCATLKNETTWDRAGLHVCMLTEDVTYHQQAQLIGPLRLRESSPDPQTPRRTLRCGVLAWRIVFNLALYLKHVDSDRLSKGGRTVNHDHGLASLLYEVGREVKLERELRDAARAFCMNGAAHKKWKLDKRFIVRGHWKQQPHGEGQAERRLIFVEPYWKGPAGAPILARVHTDEPRR